MKARITPRKTIKLPPRTLIHGEPGIGKSTFAADAPSVVFICTEQGTNNIPVRRVRIEDESAPDGERDPKTFEEVLFLLDSLVAGAQAKAEYKFVALDTVDALEKIIHDHVCRLGNKKSVADFGFQKGFDLAVDAMRMVLSRLERLQVLDVGPILLSHTQTSSFNNPEGQNFDFYDIKTHKKVAGLLVEWSDNVLFAKREQYALEEGGKVRGVGGGARFIHTQKSPSHVAKNRYSLPEKMPLSWHEYADGMARHKPADPEELAQHAQDLIKQLDEETQKIAIESLSKINKRDAHTLAQFVDYCRAKVNTAGVAPPTDQKEEKSNDAAS